MVAVKGKFNSVSNHVMQHPKANKRAIGAPSFKVYAEAEPDKLQIQNSDPHDSECKKPVSLYGGRPGGSTSALKSLVRNSKKIKGQQENTVKADAERKVLADISNVRIRGSFSKKKAQDKSKSSNSVGGTWSASCSSSKPFTENARRNLIQATGNHQTFTKATCKDAKATSDDCRTKIQESRLFSATSSRMSERNHLPTLRKSLPALKKVNKAHASDFKEQSTQRLERSRGKYGFPVKPKVGTNVASQVSYAQSQLWKNRVSDGCITMTSKGQNNTNGGALSRRSVKPTLKTTTTVVKIQTSKSRSVYGLKKLTAGATISSKRKQDMGKSSSSNHIASANTNEQPVEEVSSLSKSNLERATTDTVAKRNSDRRKSFTSLLMSKSKEDLPNIYDHNNHLEVSEYVDDIYQYYWVMEAHNQPLKKYMETQTEITPQMRGILINWLVEVHLKFGLMQETLFLMVTLLDHYLSLANIKKSEMQLVGLTALLLASKYEDFWHPRIKDLISISADSYTRDQMLGMETAFLKTLKFRLNAPTPYVFMLRFIRAAQSDTKVQHLAFYFIELCLVEYEALVFKPSLLCASAIYLARCTMQITPAWTLLLRKHSHYEESEIRHCADMILKFHKGAKTALLKVTYEKYMKPEFSQVAALHPLEMLPQRCA